jgi:hypothetical protein
MLLDGTNFEGGGGYSSPRSRGCQQPIAPGQRATRIHFATDPLGFRGLSGRYHAACGRPFVSMARIINMRAPGSR